jgi:hypothetical protein
VTGHRRVRPGRPPKRGHPPRRPRRRWPRSRLPSRRDGGACAAPRSTGSTTPAGHPAGAGTGHVPATPAQLAGPARTVRPPGHWRRQAGRRPPRRGQPLQVVLVIRSRPITVARADPPIHAPAPVRGPARPNNSSSAGQRPAVRGLIVKSIMASGSASADHPFLCGPAGHASLPRSTPISLDSRGVGRVGSCDIVSHADQGRCSGFNGSS